MHCAAEVGWLLSWQALALSNVPAKLLGTGTGASTNPDRLLFKKANVPDEESL